jgi:hypothetical protein
LLRRGPLRSVRVTRRDIRLKQTRWQARDVRCTWPSAKPPALAAVTILRRYRRTSSTTDTPTGGVPAVTASSGPFTHHGRLTCPSGSGGVDASSSQAHLPTSACFHSRAQAWYPAGYTRNDLVEGPVTMLLAFPLPFGRRRSLLGHPVPAQELGLPHGRLTTTCRGGPGRGFHVPHA